MVNAIEAAGGTLVQYTEYGGAGHGIWGQVFNLEKMYKALQKCDLSDRYPDQPEPEPEESGFDVMAYLPYAGIAVGVLVILLVVILVIKKKKK